MNSHFRTLKKRRLHFRPVPVPDGLMKELVAFTWTMPRDGELWPWCRTTAWRRVKIIMEAAGISGPQATAKGLRHGFGIANAQSNIPLGTTRRWMGHESLETTSIYQDATGAEERAFAKRLWTD